MLKFTATSQHAKNISSNLVFSTIENPLSNKKLVVLGDAKHQSITHIIHLTHDTEQTHPLLQKAHYHKDAFTKEAQQITAFLSGEHIAWDMHLHINATAFQTHVLKTLANVPYGSTVSYTELAQKSGNAKACRAVASVCAKNPIPLVIPCHRVIHSDGKIGKFAWGSQYKATLLNNEKMYDG